VLTNSRDLFGNISESDCVFVYFIEQISSPNVDYSGWTGLDTQTYNTKEAFQSGKQDGWCAGAIQGVFNVS
jgi:hypothetical protein